MKTPKKPVPQQVGSAQLCELTGLSDRRHRQLVQEGYLPAPARGHWDLFATVKGLLRFYRETADARGGSTRYRAARAAREESRARKEAVEADLSERNVVSVENAARTIARAAREVRQRLDTIPSKMAVLLENRTLAEREVLLRDELDSAYVGFTKLHPQRLKQV